MDVTHFVHPQIPLCSDCSGSDDGNFTLSVSILYRETAVCVVYTGIYGGHYCNLFQWTRSSDSV